MEKYLLLHDVQRTELKISNCKCTSKLKRHTVSLRFDSFLVSLLQNTAIQNRLYQLLTIFFLRDLFYEEYNRSLVAMWKRKVMESRNVTCPLVCPILTITGCLYSLSNFGETFLFLYLPASFRAFSILYQNKDDPLLSEFISHEVLKMPTQYGSLKILPVVCY